MTEKMHKIVRGEKASSLDNNLNNDYLKQKLIYKNAKKKNSKNLYDKVEIDFEFDDMIKN